MSRRTILILIFVFALVLLSIVGVFAVLQQDQPIDTATETDGTPGAPAPDGLESDEPAETVQPLVEVVVSLQTVPRGHQMTEDILALDMRPIDTVGNNVITSIEEAENLFARTDIYQGETLTYDTLVDDITQVGLESFGPSSLIPPGYVAQSVPMNRLTGVAYGVSEGDYVDIMVTFLFRQIDEEFQTYLPNNAAFYLEEQIEAIEALGAGDVLTTTTGLIIFPVEPVGRFEELPTGDLAHIFPNEEDIAPRPVPVSMIIQNARVIQVGQYSLPGNPADLVPTPTPEPAEEGEPTPTPPPALAPTATPPPPDVIVVALQPQQQLLLRYAVEVNAQVFFALRGVNDGQLYSVENMTLDFLLERFNVEIPPNLGYSVESTVIQITPTPPPEEGSVPE
ncbi:SAF domain-containing protein [Candidatus Leptofilum sp.]|uniref:SAF domain-containing protein n=1 Tax=Candidatus Leptofilum sp. TaxID=3241576 RepID=UPI003B5BFDE2